MQDVPRRYRAAYSVLIGIILLTIPCYLIGIAALIILQRPDQPALSPTPTRAATATFPALPTDFGSLLQPTATVPAPPTLVPTIPLMPTIPVEAPLVTATASPTSMPTSTPTSTPTPSATPTAALPTDTPTPVPVFTVETPTPTATSTPTETPTPSVEPTIEPTITPIP